MHDNSYDIPYAQRHDPITEEIVQPRLSQSSSQGAPRRTKVLPLVVSGVIGGAIATGGNLAYNHFSQNAPQVLNSSTNDAIVVNNADKVNGTSAVAQKALPSVVTVGIAAQNGQGSGSGVVIDDKGHILTNNHVVTADGKVSNPVLQIKDSKGDVYDATVVGTDPASDLAVLKVEGAKLTPIEFGDSNKLNVGERAVAIGAPLGLSESVTDGIISSLSRTISVQAAAAPNDLLSQPQENQNQAQESPFKFQLPGGDSSQNGSTMISLNVIQTDAAINPGNSGGALLDLEGKLIGINVAIASPGNGQGGAGGNVGVGFAIPSDYAKRVSQEIIANGKVSHGYLGVTINSHAANNNQQSTFSDGAGVEQVVPNSPMAQAGFQVGDVITEYNGKDIPDAATLTASARQSPPGTPVEIGYMRNGQAHKATVTVGENKQ